MEGVRGRASACMAMALASARLPISFASLLPSLPLRWPPRPLPASISLASSPRLSAPFAGLVSMSRFQESFELSDDSSQPVLSSDQEENGPVEIPADVDILGMPEMSPLRAAGSVLLTGAIALFLFRSLRKRAQRSREMKFRSSGVESVKVKTENEDTSSAKPVLDVKQPPPSALQTIQGAILSGGIAYILYKFTVQVEGSFAGKLVSPDYTIRQLTITIRTIINGMCYLATFVFAANSIGLTLYTLQLAFNSGQSQPPEGGEDETDSNSKVVEAVSEESTEKE